MPLISIDDITNSSKSKGPTNYRPAEDPTRSCGACTFFDKGQCTKFSIPVDQKYTCDSFSPQQIGKGPLAQLSKVIQPSTPISPEQAADPGTSDIKLSPEQAFKAGFLMKCIDDGLNDDQIRDRIQSALRLEKRAVADFVLPFPPVGEILSGAGNLLGAGLIGVPTTIGAIGGYTAAKATGTMGSSVDKLKQQEILDTYNFLADQAEQKAKDKRQQQGLPSSGKIWQLKGKDEDVELPG